MYIKHLIRHVRVNTPNLVENITHFLCIPLTTPTSRLLIRDASYKMMNDPLSSGIPKRSFNYPEELFINLGNLSLDTPQQLDQARTFLRGLDLQSIINTVFYLSAAYDQSTKKMTPSSDSFLDVAVEGLYPHHPQTQPQHDFEKSLKLYARVIDRDGFLPRVCADISRPFTDAGLVIQRFGTRPPWQNLLDGIFVRVVDSNRIPKDMGKQFPRLQVEQIKRRARFDATDLLDKYRDLVWTEHFRLERLGIYQLGLHDILRDGRFITRGYREIESVPLPGAPIGQPAPWVEGCTYVKHQRLRTSGSSVL